METTEYPLSRRHVSALAMKPVMRPCFQAPCKCFRVSCIASQNHSANVNEVVVSGSLANNFRVRIPFSGAPFLNTFPPGIRIAFLVITPMQDRLFHSHKTCKFSSVNWQPVRSWNILWSCHFIVGHGISSTKSNELDAALKNELSQIMVPMACDCWLTLTMTKTGNDFTSIWCGEINTNKS